jgi:hypothetical protein
MTAAKSKPAKEKNPLVLNAEVCRAGRHRLLGEIVKVTKSLLTVKWDTGTTQLFGRRGQAFYGHAGDDGEAITLSSSGKPLDDVWGGDNDVRITIATEGAKFRITQGLAERAKAAVERAAKQAEIEADPAFQKRQADLARYGELLKQVSGHVQSSWNKQENFRIELENISPDKIGALVQGIIQVLK